MPRLLGRFLGGLSLCGCVAESRSRQAGRHALDALVECAQAGDAQAFRVVTERLEPQLVRYVSSYLRGDEDTARDVVQDTFVTAWAKIATIRNGGHLTPWLYRVARCKAITWLRRRGPKGVPMSSLERAAAAGRILPDDGAGDPVRRHLEAPLSGPLRDALRRAVAKLPPLYAGVVRLHYFHGNDTRETAHLLGVPRTTVKMRLFRARQKLRKLLEDEPGLNSP